MTKIRSYRDYLSDELLHELWNAGEPVPGIDSMRVAPGLQTSFADLETPEALEFIQKLYARVADALDRVLEQRKKDRAFIDAATTKLQAANEGVDYHSPSYQTIIGLTDDEGRVVVGPLEASVEPYTVEIPEFIKGEQITLFGPPDTAKMCINAMNALHRQLPNEDPFIQTLVDASGQVPRWGADSEDSKTPIMRDLLMAARNLKGCFNKTLSFDDPKRNKSYRLQGDRPSIPIKRIAGLALPDGNHLVDGEPLPLHLYDFAQHLFHNWSCPEALVFYVPKLENEEEAAYITTMIRTAEEMIVEAHPSYEMGTVKLFIVFENPRAIFRIQEMVVALRPYFLGGSLGWHDFLGSTARLFKNDPNYRIPVKADPDIVINHIRESHEILVASLTPFGALKIGGMYGILYEAKDPKSFEVSMVGFIKDLVTQLKRGLDGFWIAHPDFVRIGIALVHAYRCQAEGNDSLGASPFDRVVEILVPNESERGPLMEFIHGPDVEGLESTDALYNRGVLASDVQISGKIANDHPDEIRYNVFQAVQYLADWLSGNGCVALPAKMMSAEGKEVFVRVMDDLATTERSRWELWAEVHHGRVSRELFLQILQEEIDFIQRGQDTENKRVQVPWGGATERWYPAAIEILKELVLSDDPPEFATELLMPFTLDLVREREATFASNH